MDDKLGPLPEPGTRTDWHHDGYGKPAYTADQMRAYAAQEVAADRERWTEAVMTELDGNGQALAIVAYATRT